LIHSTDPTLVTDLSIYVLKLHGAIDGLTTAHTRASYPDIDETVYVTPAQNKKRKLDTIVAANGSESGWVNQYHKADHIVGDVSFSLPQRKKLKLEWIGCSVDLSRRGMRAVGGDGAIEFGCGWKDLGTSMLSPPISKFWAIMQRNLFGLGSLQKS